MRIKKPLLIASAVGILGLGLRVGLRPGSSEAQMAVTSGTVEATDAQLGFPVSGLIEQVAVHEGDSVAAGAELAYLDRREAFARRAQAVAQAQAARALLRELERGFRSEEIAQARAMLEAATRRADDARQEYDRARLLREGGAVSQEALDRAHVALDVAAAEQDRAAQQLRLVRSGPRPEQIDAQRAQLAQAEAAIQGIDASLANMVIRAPFGGIVTVRHREPGEIVPAGSPVLTLMNPADRWVRIYVPENRLGAVRLGARAAITSDTYRAKSYPGEVRFIGREAEFTPKTVQTAEERVKLVYAVKVFVFEDPTHDLKPGMPADVRLPLAAP
jgi:HlyD family secretion protein